MTDNEMKKYKDYVERTSMQVDAIIDLAVERGELSDFSAVHAMTDKYSVELAEGGNEALLAMASAIHAYYMNFNDVDDAPTAVYCLTQMLAEGESIAFIQISKR